MGQQESHLKDQVPTNMVQACDNASVLERRDHGLKNIVEHGNLQESFVSFRHKGATVIQVGGGGGLILSWQQNLVSSHRALASRMPSMHVPRFQKAIKARHYAAGSDSLQGRPKRCNGKA